MNDNLVSSVRCKLAEFSNSMVKEGVGHELLITDNLHLFFMNESSCSRLHIYETTQHRHRGHFYNAIATMRHGRQHHIRSMSYCTIEKSLANDHLVFCGAACNTNHYKKVICYVYDLFASAMRTVSPSMVFPMYFSCFEYMLILCVCL